jgi:hypothetical protein
LRYNTSSIPEGERGREIHHCKPILIGSRFGWKHLWSDQQISSEVLLSNIIPFPSSGLVGCAMGFVFEKDLEMDTNHCRFSGGTFFVGVQLLQMFDSMKKQTPYPIVSSYINFVFR